MKTTHIIFILLLSYFSIIGLKAQEEFFGNQNGLSVSGLNGFESKTRGLGMSFYFKNGVFLGVAQSGNKDLDIYMTSLTLGYLADLGANDKSLKAGAGLSLGFLRSYKLVSLDFALIKCFFGESNFPLSLSPSFSIEKAFSLHQENTGVMTTVLGISYTQAFFAKNKFYPFLGFSKMFGIGEVETQDFFVNIGLSIKL
jgi:hypothetical protein